MKKLKFVAILSALLLMGLAVFAQSQPSQKPKGQSGPATMKCPMMGMMGNTKSGKPMMGNMQGMQQRMAGMFSLSQEEIASRLTEKKTALGLSDAQVKQVADLIASSEQEKIKDKMQGMMGPMQARQMKCSCMSSGTK